MKSTLIVCLELGLILIFAVTPCFSEEVNTSTSEPIKYLNAVRTSDTNELTYRLFAAVKAGDIELVKSLIAKGADLNAEDESGRSPIHYALTSKNQEIFLLVIAKAVHPDSFEYKELNKVRWLLSQGMDVDAKGPGDNTLLHFSAQTGYLHVAALLISIGTDLNALNDSGQTALQVARSRRNIDIVLLIRQAQTGTFLTINQERLRHWLNASGVVPNIKSDGVHDISITNITVFSECVQGDTIPMTATIKNPGSQREVFETTLFDTTDKLRLEAKSTALGGSFVESIQDRADLILDPDTRGMHYFGNWVCIGGDVNGDGFADMLISAPGWQNGRGCAYLYYGGKHMDAQADMVFTGDRPGCFLGNQSGAFGDVNKDGCDDVIIGVSGRTWGDKADGYVNVYYGGVQMDSTPDVVLQGEAGSAEHLGLMVTTGDIDNDGYRDILAGAQGYDDFRGRVYLYWGGDPFDPMPDVVFEGERANSLFGRRIDAGGDVNGDGYADILIGARQWGDNAYGRAYLFLGNARERMDTVCDCTFTGAGRQGCNMGSSLDIFDIDNDGIDDVLVGARHAVNASGQVYIYWGGRDFNGSQPGIILNGQENSAMGGDMIECGHFNNDPYGDILAGAWRYPDWIYDHGRAYLFHGNARDVMDNKCDHIFAGEGGTMDFFGCQVAFGDVNKDGYVDVLISSQYANHGAGRCYLYYGPFETTSNITFNWDTTNASIGKHKLKVEIPPVPGEQNTEDNVKTVTIEVKEPRK